MTPLADVLARLKCVRPCADGYGAPCPHASRNASSVPEREDGKLAGCPYEAILDALGCFADSSNAARAETETLARRLELIAQGVVLLSRELRELRDGVGR
jgi:hypothetical protein